MQLPSTITVLFWLGATYIFYAIVSSFLTSRRVAAKAREFKCEEPPFEENRWPLGIDNLLRALAADKAQQFPNDVIRRFEDLKTNTYRYQILGRCPRELCMSVSAVAKIHFPSSSPCAFAHFHFR